LSEKKEIVPVGEVGDLVKFKRVDMSGEGIILKFLTNSAVLTITKRESAIEEVKANPTTVVNFKNYKVIKK